MTCNQVVTLCGHITYPNKAFRVAALNNNMPVLVRSLDTLERVEKHHNAISKKSGKNEHREFL